MSLGLKAKLLTIIPKLVMLGLTRFNEFLEEFPDAKTRSTVLILRDDRGGRMAIYIGFQGDRPVVREVDPRSPPRATTEIEMHVDTFIAVLKRRLDFRTAYIHDLVDVRSNDGLPPTYHLILWSAFMDKALEVLG